MQEIRININGRELVAVPGQNILQVALENGIDIPHLCFDERIKPYGGCGLCIVEVEGNPKLVRACSTPVKDGMIIKTETPRTETARKMALELIVSDHRGDCRPPCVLACPAHTDCQGYVGLIANGQYKEAVALIKDKLPLPASIGRVCPHPCEEECRRNLVDEPVSIAALKRFVGDIDLKTGGFIHDKKPSTGKKIAIVGSGPAGLTCGYFLAREGHDVTIYEAMPMPGGMLRYGIPEYRLPKDVLDMEIELIKKMGVEIITNSRLGSNISLDNLRRENDAVFLAIGAWKSSSMRCKGEDAKGVLGGIDFLREVTLNHSVRLGKKVLVVGGGNTAMDAARTAVRLGAEEVNVLYRRTRNEMPAEDIEIKEAEEEGVIFNFLVAPLEVISDENGLKGLVCQKMRLGEPDASGRRKPEPIPSERQFFEADTVIAAIGQQVKADYIHGLQLSKSGAIKVNETTFETNVPGVFAGGDAATGPKIAIEAVAQGKNAAEVIDSFLRGEIKPHVEPFVVRQDDLTEEDYSDREKVPRVVIRNIEPCQRKDNFREIASAYTEEEAEREALRCLECGCMDYFECKLYKYINKYGIQQDRLKGEKHKRYDEEDHPFIERNPDKCVLCGLCVRACDEIMGVSALGLVDRGFETIVKPEFAFPLKESSCISCGLCVDVCPTGACIEKTAVSKPLPVELESTHTVCSFCGVGCNTIVESKGDLVFRTIPDKKVEEGLLCVRGKFGLNHVNDVNRIQKPLVRINGELCESSWDDAIMYTVKKLQSVASKYRKGSTAIIASPRLSNEESFMLRKLGEQIETSHLGSFTLDSAPVVSNVLGYEASTNSYDELYRTDVILEIGRVAEEHPVMGIKLKRAVEEGRRLVSISHEKTRSRQWASQAVSPANDLQFFKEVIKALFDMGYVDDQHAAKNADGLEELKKSVEHIEVSADAANVAKLYGESKKAMIVVDENTVTPEAIQLLADMCVITGKIGKPRTGIIILKSKNNSQGAWDMGIQKSGCEILSLIKQGQIKAAVIVGEDPVAVNAEVQDDLHNLDFIAVFDMFRTKTSQNAHVVFPLVSSAETDGTFTRSDRKIQRVLPALKPLTGVSNFELISKLLGRLGVRYGSLDEVWEQISREIPEYKGFSAYKQEMYWPNTIDNNLGEPVLYSKQFATPDKKAKLFIHKDGRALAFRQKPKYDTVELYFDQFLKQESLEKVLR